MTGSHWVKRALSRGKFLLPLDLTTPYCNRTALKTETVKIVTYQSATVYAASTDYYFEDKEGKTMKIRVSNLPEESKIVLPTNLLESNISEGPPGANPDLVGKTFKLLYNDQDVLARIEKKF